MNRLATGTKKIEVSKWCYGRGRSYGGNYGAHCIAVTIGVIDLYWSYDTVVAFRAPGYGLLVCENVWGSTTGKHLNCINEDKKSRVGRVLFEQQLSECLASYNLAVV